MDSRKFGDIDSILLMCRKAERYPSVLKQLIEDIEKELESYPEAYTEEEAEKLRSCYFTAIHDYSRQCMKEVIE